MAEMADSLNKLEWLIERYRKDWNGKGRPEHLDITAEMQMLMMEILVKVAKGERVEPTNRSDQLN